MCSAPQAMIAAGSSTTTKSRMFSQTSANVRGSSVPSPEHSGVRRWVGSATGSLALRVRQGRRPKLLQARANFGERSFDLGWRRAGRNIVFFDYAPEFEGRGEIIAQQITELLALS